MELADLAGTHMLSGVDRVEGVPGSWSEPSPEVLRFELDGVLYGAVENPDDGYRSSMRELSVFQGRPATTFEPVQVKAVYRGSDNQEILDLIYDDRVILSVGTDYTDDWYPSFVAYWNPEPLGMVDYYG